MSELPNIPINPERILNEYHERLMGLTAANVRLTVMVHEAVSQRDDALNRWRTSEENSKMWENRYNQLVEEYTNPSGPKTVVERRVAP